jgi:streptogramin lyase
MSRKGRDLGSSLKALGDNYLESKPADFTQVREEVESRRRRRFFRAVAASVAAAGTIVLVAVAVVSLPSGTGQDSVTAEPSDLTSIVTDGAPFSVHTHTGASFVTLNGDAQVGLIGDRIAGLDLASGRVLWTSTLSSLPHDVVAARSGLWATLPEEDLLVRLDPATGAEEARVQLPTGSEPDRLTVGGEKIRVVVTGGVMLVDSVTHQVEWLLRDDRVTEIAMGNTAFWILTEDGEIFAIDPGTGVRVDGLATESVTPGGELTFVRTRLWYGREGSNGLVMIDETTGMRVAEIDLPMDYLDIDGGEAGVWALARSGDEGVLIEVDPEGGTLRERHALEGIPVDISIGKGKSSGILIALQGPNQVVHIQP